MKSYKVTVTLKDVKVAYGTNEEMKESVKNAMQEAIEADDVGDEELNFQVESDEDDF